MLEFTNMQVVGFIPTFLSEEDPRTAIEQINVHYAHGGGWHDFPGFTLTADDEGQFSLLYPEDPPMRELSRAVFRDKLLVFFEYSWLAVIDPHSWQDTPVSRPNNDAFRVARLD